jgi:hypothetical protein
MKVFNSITGRRALGGHAPGAPFLPAFGRSGLFVLVVAVAFLLATTYGEQRQSAAFASAERKIEWIAENGRSEHPSSRPTVLTAAEWNAYLNEGGVKLPEGVTRVQLTTDPAVVHGDAEVDFDRLTSNRTRNNPLLQLFTGKHHVTATAQASAVNGVGTVHVQSVEFDGVKIPDMALEYFCNHYLRPKYGTAVGMDSHFPLHSHIDTAILGKDQVTITQR